MTANARSLLNFFELRLCTRAQWEIRELAGLMLEKVRVVAPNIFSVAGPTCDTKGYCSEGEMSCGRAAPLGFAVDKEAEWAAPSDCRRQTADHRQETVDPEGLLRSTVQRHSCV